MSWTTLRTWTTGELVTAAIMNAQIRDDMKALNVCVRKSADESVTSSTVLQNDDELLFAIVASEVFTFRFALFVTDTDGGFQMAVTSPSGSTIDYSTSGVPNFAGLASASGTGLNGIPSGTSVHAVPVTIAGSVSNGSTAGNIQLQWAQAGSNANATKVLRGSHLVAQRVL